MPEVDWSFDVPQQIGLDTGTREWMSVGRKVEVQPPVRWWHRLLAIRPKSFTGITWDEPVEVKHMVEE